MSAAVPVKKNRVVKTVKGTTPGTARKVALEKVIGNTIVHNSAFSSNPATGDLAYPAGCVIVIYSPKRNKQIKFLSNKENKAISFLRYSSNGKYLAVGESGHKPAVYVWDTSTWAIVSELRGHKFGVSCGCFSPNNKYLVTVGYQHDGSLFVWDWKTGTAAASNKITTKVYAVSFSEDGTYFVTAGFRHVKFWYMDTIGAVKTTEKPVGKVPGQTTVIEGRAGVLGTNRDAVYLDVVCGTGKAAPFTFCVTSQGLICQFGPNRSMDRWVNLKSDRAFGIALSETIVACACSDGTVRLFDPNDLTYLHTIPKPHAIGKEDSGPGESAGDVYPDALAIQLSSDSQRLSIVYTDRSLLIWDLRNPKKAGFLRAFTAHCACIWDVVICPNNGTLPEGSFITCGADNTIRVWNLDAQNLTASVSASVSASISSLQKSFNKDIIHTIHAVSDTSAFKAKDNVDMRTSSEMLPSVSNDTGIRCLSITADGKQLAAGDRQGNLRIYNLPSYECVAFKEVHDAEILTLDYSSPPPFTTQSDSPPGKSTTSPTLLATASRDRLVHVFDASKNYDLVSTLDDHSSSITAVKFAVGSTRLLTCSADKSIVFRTVASSGNALSIRRYHHAVVPYGTLYDMDVDPTQKYIVSAGQDKKLSIYTINQPKVISSYKTDMEAGEVLKVSLDPAGIYAVTSCADKIMRIYDFYSGECLAKMTGHSELVTGVKFTRDCKRIISVAGDGCIFVWKLSAEFTKSMKDRLAERNPSAKNNQPPSVSVANPSLPVGAATPIVHGPGFHGPNVSPIPAVSSSSSNDQETSFDFHPVPHGEVFGKDYGDVSMMNDSIMPKFKFSETALPAWAKEERAREEKAKEDKAREEKAKGRVASAGAGMGVGAGTALGAGAKGRWAQRAESNDGFTLFSDLGEEDKPVVKWAEKDKRRFTIEPDGLNADKWASPSAREPREAKYVKDLLISDMDSSTRPLSASAKGFEDDDAVLVDHLDLDIEIDPRMRASQVGALLDGDDEEVVDEGVVAAVEEEEEKDDKEEKEEPIYFQGEDTNKGFEVDTPQAKPVPTVADKAVLKPEEDEEEFEDASLKDLSDSSKENDDEDESLRKMYEKYDFIKSNFDNLSVAPLAKNPMRLSISRKFLEQPPKDDKPTTATTGSGNTSAGESTSKLGKKLKEPLSKEVEKTRERLARMGIVLPSTQASKGSTDSSPQFSPIASLANSPPQLSTSTSPPLQRAPSTTNVVQPQTASVPTQRVSPTPVPSQTSPPQARVSPTSQIPIHETTSPTQTRATPSDSTSQFAFTQDTLRAAGTTLRRPLSEYESAIGALTSSLNKTLQMWKEVRESSQADPTASHLSQQFQSLFSSISGQIAQVDPNLTASFSRSSQVPLDATSSSQADSLEHYSDLLVERVVQKLGSVDLQNKLLQSLTSTLKSSSGGFN